MTPNWQFKAESTAMMGATKRIGMGNRRTVLAGALMLTTALATTLGVPAAYAQQATASSPTIAQLQSEQNFDIPAQPLTDALVAFGQQSGIQVTVNGTVARDVAAPAVHGTMTSEQALRQLLAGSGLTYTMAGSTVAIERPGQSADGAIVLDPVTVEGRAGPPSTALIGNLPPEYAGGQVARGGQLGLLGNKDMMDTPFNQTNYTQKLIQSQQAKSIGDVLANDPSVVKRFSDAAGIDTWDVRGLSSNGDVSFNGMFGIAPTGGNIMAVESVERVEVLKGANALLNGVAPGQGASLGIVNVVPKRAGDDPLLAFTPDYISGSQFGGHLDAGRRFGKDKEFGVRFNGVLRDGDTAIDNQSRETHLAALGLDYQGDNFRLSADFGYQHQYTNATRRPVSVASAASVIDAPDNETNWAQDWVFLETDNRYGIARAEWDINKDITTHIAVGRSELALSTISDLRTIQDAAGTITGRVIPIDSYDYTTTAELGLRARAETGPVNHDLSLSGAWTRSEVGQKIGTIYNLPNTNLYSPANISQPGDFGMAEDPEDIPKTTRRENQSFALADTLSILDGRAQLMLGVRHQEVQSKTYSTGEKYTADALSPAAALVIKPWENVSLYGNYIQALEAGQVAPNTAINAGETFAPYETKQYEVGAKVDFGRIATTLAAFTTTRPTYSTDPSTNVFEENGTERYRGIELSAFGKATDSISFVGGFTFLDPTLVRTANGANEGNRTAGQPKYRATLTMEWDTPFVSGLSLSATGQWQSATYLDSANTKEVDGWYNFDLGARYLIERNGWEPIEVRASVRNVLDADDWVATRNGLSLGAPRTFLLSSTFKF